MAIATFVELTVDPWLYERLPYDPLRDFAPVTVLYNEPQLLVANLNAAPRSLADAVQDVKKNPGRLSYGSSGVARPPHIFMEKFKLVAGIVMPAGAPAGAVTRLQREIAAALQSPDLRAAYELAGRTPVGNAPDDFAALIRRDLAEWRDVVKRSGIRPQ
jgi:tripartite-type tricarboxylate transporter receptor subunit TctC